MVATEEEVEEASVVVTEVDVSEVVTEEEVEEASEVVEVTVLKCIEQPVASVVKAVKYLSDLQATSLYTVVTALNTNEMVAQMTVGDLEVLTSATHNLVLMIDDLLLMKGVQT